MKTLNERFSEFIERRKRIDADNDVKTQEAWDEEIILLTENLNATVTFLKTDCNFEQLYWMSEVFDDITSKTHSQELVEAIKYAIEKYPEECQKENITPDFINNSN